MTKQSRDIRKFLRSVRSFMNKYSSDFSKEMGIPHLKLSRAEMDFNIKQLYRKRGNRPIKH